MNRGARRGVLFEAPGDYRAFVRCLTETQHRYPIRLFAYCVMPNHFHLVCRPDGAGDLSQFMRRLTLTHSKRWHAKRGTQGQGAVYQGRYRSSVVKSDRHFHAVCRYVERNPLRSKLVDRAEQWEWSSLGARRRNWEPAMDEWPVAKPLAWIRLVNSEDDLRELSDLRQLLRQGRPVGDPAWQAEQLEQPGG
jgi:putative transposase